MIRKSAFPGVGLVAFLVWLMVAVQCEPCNDCMQLENSPFINFRVVPTDSLAAFNAKLWNPNVALRDRYIRAADTLADNDPAKDSIILLQESVQAILDSLTPVRTLLRGNLVRLDTVWALPEATYFVNQDTSDIFELPLNPHADSSTFVIQVYGRQDTVTVYYRRTDFTNEFLLDVRADSVYLGPNTYPEGKVKIGVKSAERISSESSIRVVL